VINETLARRYATAVFSLANDGANADRVGADLAALATAIESDSLTRDFFVAPVIDRATKERVLAQVFGGKVDDVALHTVLLLVRKRRERLLPAIVVEYRKLQQAQRGAEPLTLTSAHPLSSQELAAMVERLERLYRKKFDVKHVVDPQVIGGVRVLMGDRRVDGTVSGRLEALARELFASN
jgi:F-type H+-transporting ATPase subunit delta